MGIHEHRTVPELFTDLIAQVTSLFRTETQLARAEINLGFLEQSIPERVPGSFAWINGVDFYAFVRGAFR